MAENDSGKILTTIKAALGIQPDYDPFDVELLMHINSIITITNQLGVGPEEIIIVDADTPWSALLVDDKLELAKSYLFLRVKMIFDAAGITPATMSAYERLIAEMDFRLTIASDPMEPQVEDPDLDEEDVEYVFDAGGI